MAGLYRSGTVSRSSGPIHLNSYALRGVPIKYKPPIYIPELMVLPAEWKFPAMPSEDLYRYDYSTERRVVEHARMRAVSVAAEASLEARQIRQLEEARDRLRTPPNPAPQPRPPVPFTGLTILTPTPVTPVTAAATCSNSDAGEGGAEGGVEEGGDATTKVQRSSGEEGPANYVKPLGEMSIKEFEGDNNDPFEIASLQAINDMEVLQSVLQPTNASPTTTAANLQQDTTSQQPALIVTSRNSPMPPHSSSSATDLFGSNVATTGSSPTNTAVHQPHPVIAGATTVLPVVVSSSNPFSGGLTAETVTYPNPFLLPSELNQQPVVSNNNPFAAQEPPRSASEPSVATLIDLGSHNNTANGMAPGMPPNQTQQVPIPKPRTNLPSAAAQPSHQQAPPSTFPQTVTPQPSTAAVVVAPPIPPKPTVTVSNIPLSGSPPIPPRGAPAQHPRRGSTGSPARTQQPNFPAVHTRVGLGVAVLPPIPHSSTSQARPIPPPSTSSPATPPAYQPSSPSSQRVTPPPPYFQGENHHHHQKQSGPHAPLQRPSPVPRRRAFKLPDPTSSLSTTEKAVVSSITEIGFPAPRVARAVKRCGTDQTKIVNFLIMVAGLEEQNFNGDSAELALLTCKEDTDKALAYLKKVDQYKEIGFSEKDIHDAYKSSSSDWDKALDVLMQAR